MHSFDTTIHLATLRRDELLQSAAQRRTARVAVRGIRRRVQRRHTASGRAA